MGTLDLYNVLDKLKQIENPTEDQKQAIQSTEAMTKGAVKTDASGTQTYKAYGEDSTPADLGRLAGNKPITVIKEAVELKEDEDVARDFAMNITDHILNQYDKGGLGDIVVTGTVLKGIEDTIDNADFTMMDNEKKDMAIAITKIIRDEFGTNGHSPYNIPKDADGYSFELQDVISDYIMKAGSMEEMPAESVSESDIDMFADIDKVAPKINKMKMDLVDGGMEPEDAHDEACEKYGVDPEDYDKYLEFKSSIKYPEKSIKTEGHMSFDQAYDKLGDPADETIAYEIKKLEKHMKPEEYKKLVDYFKEKRGADVFEGRMSDAMIGAEEIVFGYFDGEGLPRMTDEEMIVDLEVRRSQAKTPQEDLELSIAIDMIEKGEHLSMNEAHCNTKRKKTEDADPVDDKDPKYADDMHLKKPMSKQEKGDQDYVDNYDRNKHIADMEDELGEVEAMIAGTKDKGEIRTYNYIAADIRDQIQRLKAGEDITDYGPEDDFIEKIKPTEGKDMKELKIMDDLQAKFESEMQEESKKETVAESDIDMFADIDKKASKINKMKMDLVDGGMEPEDAHDEACEKHGVDPEDYDKYLELKSSIKYPEKKVESTLGILGDGHMSFDQAYDKLGDPPDETIAYEIGKLEKHMKPEEYKKLVDYFKKKRGADVFEGHMDFDQAYDKLGDPPDETIAYEIGKLEKYMKPEEYKKLVDYFKEKRGADVFEGKMSDAMIGAEEIVFGYFDGEGLPTMTDEEMIVDLEVRRSMAKTPQEDLELSIAIDMIEKGEHLSMNEAHCNTKRKKTEDADPVDDKDPKYADDMHLKKPMSKQEKGDQDYVDNYDRNKHIADMEDELGEVEAMIAGTKDKGEIRTYNYIAADIRDQIQRLKAGEDITDYGPEDDFIEKIKPTEGKDMKELKIMDDLQAKFESEMKEESKKETVAESTETKKETVKEDYSITMDVNETGDRSVQVSAANESADELLDLLNLSGLRSKGYTEVSEDDINEDELANSPDEKVQTDYDAQWNGAAGGNAKPNHPSAQKSSTHPLHASVEESVTEEKMTDLYKEYKGEEKAEEKKGE